MSKLPTLDRDNFKVKKVRVSDEGVEATFQETRIIAGQTHIIEHDAKAKYLPHPDLTGFMEDLKIYLYKAYGINVGFDLALNYSKGGQKQKCEQSKTDVLAEIEVTAISVSGTGDLKGAVISGKTISFNDAKVAMNTPRIVFKSEKLGFEQEVEQKIGLIESEVYKYFYEAKSSQESLFKGKQQPVEEGMGLQ